MRLPPSVSAWSLDCSGCSTSSAASRWAGRWALADEVAVVAGLRRARVAVLVFLLSPKTATTMLIFAAVMGLTYLSTVPPTAGLVAQFFGPANMATLFGIVMLSHQIGGFTGAWLAAKCSP